MRRMILLTAAMALVVLAAVPAGAAPVDKTSFIVAECADAGNPQAIGRMWFPTEGLMQIREAVNVYHEYLYVDGSWATEPFATNTTVANVSPGAFWGTWSFDDFDGSTMGDFEGTWVFSKGAAKATGKSDDGRVAKVNLGLMDPAPPSENCGVAEFIVFDK